MFQVTFIDLFVTKNYVIFKSEKTRSHFPDKLYAIFVLKYFGGKQVVPCGAQKLFSLSQEVAPHSHTFTVV